MQLSIKLDTGKLLAALNRAPLAVAKELRVEMKQGLRVVCTDARMHHKFKTKSGQLERSISYEVTEDGLSGRVFLDDGVAPYGKYQHDGARPHIIRPKNKAALYFVIGGRKFFVPKNAYGEGGVLRDYWRSLKAQGAVIIGKGFVNHPGITGDHFLVRAYLRQRTYLVARLQAATNRAFAIAGVK